MKARGYAISASIGAAIGVLFGLGCALLAVPGQSEGSWWAAYEALDRDSPRELNALIQLIDSNSFVLQEAQAQLSFLEQIRYDEARAAHDVYVYAAFLEDFPDSPHADEIEAIFREHEERISPTDGGDYAAVQMGSGEARR